MRHKERVLSWRWLSLLIMFSLWRPLYVLKGSSPLKQGSQRSLALYLNRIYPLRLWYVMKNVWRSRLPSFVDIMIYNLSKASVRSKQRCPAIRNVLHHLLCLYRSDSHPTSVLISRTFYGTCCRWIWPSASGTWRMAWVTSRPTSGSPPPTGLLFTRGRCGSALY